MNAPIGIYVSTPEGRFLDVNPAMALMFGYESPWELIDSVEDIGRQLYFDSQDREKIVRQLEQGNEVRNFECRFLRRDGAPFWASDSVRAVKNEKGNIVNYQGFLSDITEHTRAKEALRESEAQFRFLTESMMDVLWTLDLNFKTTYVSQSIEKILGFTPEERVRQEAVDIMTPESFARIVDTLARELEKERLGDADPDRSLTIEVEYYHKDGHTVWMENVVSGIRDRDGTLIGIHGVSRDVTGRKDSEKTSREHVNRFQKLSSHVPGVIHQFLRRPDGTYCVPLSTKAIRDIFGCSPQEVREDFSPIRKVILPDDLGKVVDSIEFSAKHMTPWQCEYRVKVPDRPVRWMFGQSTPEKLADGSILWHGFSADVTARKKIEESLRESNARLHTLSDNLPSGYVYQLDLGKNGQQRQFTYLSAGVEQVHGITVDDVLADSTVFYTQVFEEDRQMLAEREALALENMLPFRVEIRVRKSSCETKWILLSSAPRLMPNDHVVCDGIAIDITEQKMVGERLEESLEKIKRTLCTTVQAMADTVNTKDPYTAGHQHRVADLARSIATEINLPQDQIEGIHMAGILHDLGKISVPSEILSKPTRLTNIEFALIKTHVHSGYNILKDIDFPWPIARMVIEHHERMDGSGYPNGLTGDKLLIESRILAVADVVEATASHRPYRPALGINAALEEIAKNRGVFYDPVVVDACLRLFREKGYTLKE